MLELLRTVFTDPITLGVIGFFGLLAALESLAPRRALPEVPRWRLKGALFLLLSIAISATVPRAWDAWLAEHRLIDARALGDVGGAILGFVAFELALYGWHRALHRSDFLWRWFHQMHHSAERVDVFGAYYFHPFDVVAFAFLSSVSLVGVLGVTANAALFASLAITVCGLFQHANLRTPRWIGFLVQRPESHAVHHERGLHAGNYSDLALWDLVFGTFRNPASHDAAAGFYDGASREVGAMLVGRDVTKPAPRAENGGVAVPGAAS
jgi:sterol desaturase/sphingolipid hydroxylase (fatty acid hydroxylase superfamily)